MYHPIVKEQVLPGQLEELQTNPHPTETSFKSQALIQKNLCKTLGRRIQRRVRGADSQFAWEGAKKTSRDSERVVTILAPVRNGADACFEWFTEDSECEAVSVRNARTWR